MAKANDQTGGREPQFSLFELTDVLSGTASEATREKLRKQYEDPNSDLRRFIAEIQRTPSLLGPISDHKMSEKPVVITRQHLIDFLLGKRLPQEVLDQMAPDSDVERVICNFVKYVADRGDPFDIDLSPVIITLLNKGKRPSRSKKKQREQEQAALEAEKKVYDRWFEGTRFAQH